MKHVGVLQKPFRPRSLILFAISPKFPLPSCLEIKWDAKKFWLINFFHFSYQIICQVFPSDNWLIKKTFFAAIFSMNFFFFANMITFRGDLLLLEEWISFILKPWVFRLKWGHREMTLMADINAGIWTCKNL